MKIQLLPHWRVVWVQPPTYCFLDIDYSTDLDPRYCKGGSRVFVCPSLDYVDNHKAVFSGLPLFHVPYHRALWTVPRTEVSLFDYTGAVYRLGSAVFSRVLSREGDYPPAYMMELLQRNSQPQIVLSSYFEEYFVQSHISLEDLSVERRVAYSSPSVNVSAFLSEVNPGHILPVWGLPHVYIFHRRINATHFYSVWDLRNLKAYTFFIPEGCALSHLISDASVSAPVRFPGACVWLWPLVHERLIGFLLLADLQSPMEQDSFYVEYLPLESEAGYGYTISTSYYNQLVVVQEQLLLMFPFVRPFVRLFSPSNAFVVTDTLLLDLSKNRLQFGFCAADSLLKQSVPEINVILERDSVPGCLRYRTEPIYARSL